MANNIHSIIIYQMIYEDLQSWDYFSNLLCKFFQKETMSLDETQKVLANTFQDSTKNDDILRNVLRFRDEFKPISKPENFKENPLYNTVFYIYVDLGKLKDIMDLQRLYLIKRSFEEKRILVILEGQQKDYFKVSHFFEWVNEKNERFHNSVYFHDKAENSIRIIRMQKKKIAAFQNMLPLLEIDQEAHEMLRRQVKDMCLRGEVYNILKNRELKPELSKLDLINSALRQIWYYKHKNKYKVFQNCDSEKLAEILENINLLTLFLFTIILSSKSEPYRNILELQKVLWVLKNYVQGCLQLTENILFHTQKKNGIFSLRFLQGNSEYAIDKYNLQKGDRYPFFEICISDYPGENESGNIAQVFVQKLNNQELKKLFKGLKPVHFFQCIEEMEEKVHRAWEKYYDDIEHISRHYGLRIFKTLVDGAGGKFIMESYSTHRPEEGEQVGAKNKTIGMPGTSYSILMPANFEEQYLNDKEIDFGIANVISYETNLNEIKKIECHHISSEIMKESYVDEEGKYRIVDHIKNAFSDYTDNGKDIILVDASEIPKQNAELIYKALIKISKSQIEKKYVAFYNCNPEFVSEFWNIAHMLFLQRVIQYILQEKELQIILFTSEDYEEMMVIPGSYNLTLQLNNQINFTKETRWKSIFLNLEPLEEEEWQIKKKREIKILPFDVLIQLKERGEELSVFEHYTKKIVNRSIQQEFLGCKFEDTL